MWWKAGSGMLFWLLIYTSSKPITLGRYRTSLWHRVCGIHTNLLTGKGTGSSDRAWRYQKIAASYTLWTSERWFTASSVEVLKDVESFLSRPTFLRRSYGLVALGQCQMPQELRGEREAQHQAGMPGTEPFRSTRHKDIMHVVQELISFLPFSRAEDVLQLPRYSCPLAASYFEDFATASDVRTQTCSRMYIRPVHTEISRSRSADYSDILHNLLVGLFAFHESSSACAMTQKSHTALVMRNDARSRARDLPSSLLDIPRSSFLPLIHLVRKRHQLSTITPWNPYYSQLC